MVVKKAFSCSKMRKTSKLFLPAIQGKNQMRAVELLHTRVDKENETIPSPCFNPYLYLYEKSMNDFELLNQYGKATSVSTSPPRSYSKLEDASNPTLNLRTLLFFQLRIAPLRRLFSWAIPSDFALQTIQNASPNGVIEIGAGSGYWSSLLQKRNVFVLPFDLFPLEGKEVNRFHTLSDAMAASILHKLFPTSSNSSPLISHLPSFTQVNKGGPIHAHDHPKKTLLLCWPPSEEGEKEVSEETSLMGVNSLEAYGGSTLVHVGELPERWEKIENGEYVYATGGKEFRSRLFSDWEMQERVKIPQWPTAKDELTVWKRKRILRMSSNDRVSVPFDEGIIENEDKQIASSSSMDRASLGGHQLHYDKESSFNEIGNDDLIALNSEISTSSRLKVIGEYDVIWKKALVSLILRGLFSNSGKLQFELSELEKRVIREKKDLPLLFRILLSIICFVFREKMRK